MHPHRSLNRFYSLFVFCATLFLISLETQGQSYEALAENKYLFPKGSTDGIYFRSGTEVSLTSSGEVEIGTLAFDTYLFPQSTLNGLYFAANTQVRFNVKGEVVSGTPLKNPYLFPTGSTDGRYFAAGCVIHFNAKGEVERGTLLNSEYLFPQNSTEGIYFKAHCPVSFNLKGEVIVGTLRQDTYLFPAGSTDGRYYKANARIVFNNRGEVARELFSGCDCQEDLLMAGMEGVMAQFYDIVNGIKPLQDRTVLQVLERNSWPDNGAAVDVTASMDPYVAQVYMWLKLNASASQTIYYTFFNDGDRKEYKPIGNAGGLYSTSSNNLTSLVRLITIAKASGDGGDPPENDIEAILHTIRNCSRCQSIIHVADNQATPRDLSLLRRVTKPVHVIVCGMYGDVNPALLDIARQTGGSLHTIEEDIRHLSGLSIGDAVSVGRGRYRLTASGFVKDY